MITAFRDIKKIIEQEEEPENQITELNFSSVKIFRFTQKIKTIVEKCENLIILKLCECQLSSLQKLPELDIVSLDLSINKLKDSDLQSITKYKNLSILNLGDNLISTLSSIKVLAKFTELKDLQLAGNQIEKQSNYREYVFNTLKCLELLDKLNSEGDLPIEDSHSDDIISEDDEEDHDQDQSEGQEVQSDDQQEGSYEDEESENFQVKRKFRNKSQSSQ